MLHGDLHHGNLLSAERIRVLAEAVRFDPTDVRAWGWVLAVIAAWWSFEDGERDWEPWLACAAAIQRSG